MLNLTGETLRFYGNAVRARKACGRQVSSERYKKYGIPMNSIDMANLIYVGIIPLAAGILAILFNYRIIGKKPGEDYRWDNWHNDYSKIFKLVGPILVAIGLIRITGILFQN